MSYYWVRDTFTTSVTPYAQVLLATIPPGYTYTRYHIRWGVYADTPLLTDLAGTALNIVTLGICTTIGNGTELPPDPRTAAFDADPPTQRWVYWETRGLVPTAISEVGNVVTWRDNGSTEPSDSKGQVLATGIPSGDTLNLWGVFALPFGWAIDSNIVMSLGISILVREP